MHSANRRHRMASCIVRGWLADREIGLLGLELGEGKTMNKRIYSPLMSAMPEETVGRGDVLGRNGP